MNRDNHLHIRIPTSELEQWRRSAKRRKITLTELVVKSMVAFEGNYGRERVSKKPNSQPST